MVARPHDRAGVLSQPRVMGFRLGLVRMDILQAAEPGSRDELCRRDVCRSFDRRIRADLSQPDPDLRTAGASAAPGSMAGARAVVAKAAALSVWRHGRAGIGRCRRGYRLHLLPVLGGWDGSGLTELVDEVRGDTCASVRGMPGRSAASRRQ